MQDFTRSETQTFLNHEGILPGLKPDGRGWRGPCCWADHSGDGTGNSMVVSENGLMHCHSHQCGGNIFDLYRERNPGLTDKQAAAEVFRIIGRVKPEQMDLQGQGSGGKLQKINRARPSAFYLYTAPDDPKSTYRVARYDFKEDGEQKKRIFHERLIHGKWEAGKGIMDGIPRRLYHQDQLAAATTILYPEGEKCVEAVEALGYVATCNSGGAGHLDVTLCNQFDGKDLVLLQDNDEPGLKHVNHVAHHAWDYAKSIKIVLLPGLAKKGDVYDWIKAGGTRDQLAAIIAATAPLSERPAPPAEEKKADAPSPDLIRVQSGRDLMNKKFAPLIWLVEGILTTENLAMLADRPKRGKSWLVLALAIALAGGTKFLDHFRACDPMHVLYFALEDSELRMRDRVKKVGASDAAIENIDFAYKLKLDEAGLKNLEGLLDAAMAEGNPYGFVVIDTFFAAAAARKNNHDVVRQDYNELSVLQTLARKCKCAILVVHHTRKPAPGAGEALDDLIGTTGVTAAPDTIMVLSTSKEGERVLRVQGKDTTLGHDLELEFDGSRTPPWTFVGVYSPMSEDQKLVYEAVAPEGSTLKEIVDRTGRSKSSTCKMLQRMARDGLMRQRDDDKWCVVECGF